MAFLSSRANHCAGLNRGGDDGAPAAAAAAGGEQEPPEVPAEARRGDGDVLTSPATQSSRTADSVSGGSATTTPAETVPRSAPVEDDVVSESRGGVRLLCFRLLPSAETP